MAGMIQTGKQPKRDSLSPWALKVWPIPPPPCNSKQCVATEMASRGAAAMDEQKA